MATSLPGSQEMSMPSFMPIGPKLWALEGYIQTDTRTDRLTDRQIDRQTDRQSFFYYIDLFQTDSFDPPTNIITAPIMALKLPLIESSFVDTRFRDFLSS